MVWVAEQALARMDMPNLQLQTHSSQRCRYTSMTSVPLLCLNVLHVQNKHLAQLCSSY